MQGAKGLAARLDEPLEIEAEDNITALATTAYLDYNATSPVAPIVLAAMLPFFAQRYGNASSAHAYGFEAHDALATARDRVASLLNCDPDEIVFTGGGSESNNLAIKGTAFRHLNGPFHVITSVIDHPAVLNTCHYLADRFGARLTVLPVDHFGMVDAAAVADAVTPDTVLVSVMLANNEVGTIQPIREIALRCRQVTPSVVIHTDAAQAVGKIPVDVLDLDVDLLTLAAHKFCGPKGVGALYVRRGIALDSVIHGSGHEHGCRAGTENVAGIVGLGMAAKLAAETMSTEVERLQFLRDRLQSGIMRAIPDAVVHGHPAQRLPNTLNIAIPGVAGNAILQAAPGVAASTGSACHSGSSEPSSVLLSMGVLPEVAGGALRLSVGRFTTKEQIDQAVEEITEAAKLFGGF